MAEVPEPTNDDVERRRRRRRAAMAPPVVEDGDVAFGGMAGIGVLAAVLAALFGFFGLAAFDRTTTAEPMVETPPVTEPADDGEASGPDLPAILGELNDAGYEGLQLSADGATVAVTGEVPDTAARDAVITLVSAQPGVEQVIDRLSITPEETPTPGDALVTVTDDSVVLAGVVPSDTAAEELRAFAAGLYRSEQITDELVVVEGATPATVTIEGSVTGQESASALLDGLEALASQPIIIDNLAVEADAGQEINEALQIEPILFQSGTALILPESEGVLGEAARILQENPGAVVEIGGHTDSLGPDDANQILSEQRAQAVLQALRDLGVTNELTAVGYGESRLLFPDDKGDTPDKEEARQANRRIEFTTLN